MALLPLQRACFYHLRPPESPDLLLAVALAGPWTSSLRTLGADFGTLARHVSVLASAPQLEHVGVMGMPSRPGSDVSQFFNWAAQHPSLQRLQFEHRAVNSVVDFEVM